MELTLHQKIESEGHKVYGSVNRMWPEKLPILEKDEAERAYKRLIVKFGTKKVWDGYPSKWITEKMKIRQIRKRGAPLGNANPRYWKTRVRKCWLSLNGDTNDLHKGWRRLIHDVSHYVYHFRFPNNSEGHNIAQAKIEYEMAKFVIESGWLEGKLKAKPKEKHKEDVVLLRFSRMLKREKIWERKLKLATSHLKKVKREIKVYERRHNKVSVN
tara:strand:- start:50 stop:691 length:642 start_codon:yes stop_codon:yes gene_type:complete